jgi:exopolyphosphatase/guanosine-5'-triphosphate,3'-diphosphate pyrophosphatase
MKGDRIAVIDLGSNTFHLLICEEGVNSSWTEIHKEREYVKLGESGINEIGLDSEQRAIDAMVRFASLIQAFKVKNVRAIGTAALRESINGREVAEKLKSITGIPIEIIDGQQEANYILEGIRSVLPSPEEESLIMDIGGGSVEFILYRGDRVYFTGSFKIGVAVLYTRFHHSDPVSGQELKELNDFLEEELSGLAFQLSQRGSYYLIGASGSFEVIYDAMPSRSINPHCAEIDASTLLPYLQKVIHASLAERKQMPEIPVERLDYIVVAYALIHYLLQNMPPSRVYYCEYALKEGVVASMIKNS